jgi:TrmH family RNA methyltransferase
MKKMTTTETPPPVVGLFRFEKTPPENRLKTILTKMKEAAAPPCWVILDRLQDPGNVGTIIRSALAFGATGVMTTQNTVDVYSPKVIRSSTGLVFTCSVVDSDLTLKDLVERVLLPAGLQVYAGVGHADTPEYRLADFTKPTALIFGQEGTGVEASVLDQQEALQIQGIRIPMENGVESLNVSISAAVILAEVQTQRTRVVASGPLSLENG